jgi:hypothetical protein
MKHIGPIFAGSVVVYLVGWVLFHMTLIAIQSFERFERERAEGHQCLVWGSK